MKSFIYLLLITFFLSGCSKCPLPKERDARNAFIERPLVIPPNIDKLNVIYNKVSNINDYTNETIFLLIFKEDVDLNKCGNNIPLTHSDNIFLQTFNLQNISPDIKDELNKEYLNITTKNQRFINKILHWEVNESLKITDKNYKDLNT